MKQGSLPSIYLWGSPLARRASPESMASLIVEHAGRQATTAAYFIFVSHDRYRVWVLHWDGVGICVYSKHTSGGRKMPAPWAMLAGEGALRMTREEVLSLTEGCRWEGRVSLRTRHKDRRGRKVSACTVSPNMRDSQHAKPLAGDEP
ncbi:MAG: IS66 family insertion sequence element accessory protein TnpB [Chrysiogenetes bacterium]|nr:IS66 family insertion sequence element accessory protein TnpB [Chrysiogenetes bacterium]